MKKYSKDGVGRTCATSTRKLSNNERLTSIVDRVINKSRKFLYGFTAMNSSEQKEFLNCMDAYVSGMVRASAIHDRFFYGIILNYYAALHIVDPQKYPLPNSWDAKVKKLGLKCEESLLRDLINKNREH